MTQIFKAGDKVSYGDFVGVLRTSEIEGYPVKLPLEDGSLYFTEEGRDEEWTPVILKMLEDGKGKPTIVVWFSCGAASAVAAKKTIEKYGATHTIRIVNNPIKEEDSDNQRFLKDVEKWLGIEIEIASNSNFPDNSAVTVWEKRRFMSGPRGAPCTQELKKKARQEWEKNNHFDYLVLGFTSEEVGRYERFKAGERENILPILIEAGITKEDCFKILTDAGLTLPRVYFQGYPNANCIGCVKATSVTYWNHVRKTHPDIFKERAEQSRDIGARLTRYEGKRIFLDELPEDAKGRSMKSMNIDCGIFCEEP